MSSCKKIKKKFTDIPDKKSSYHCGLSKNAHSPTVKLLQNCKIIPSPEEKESATLQLSVLCDIKESVSKLKLKRCDKAREAMDFLTASFGGENVKKSRAKSSLAKKTWSSDPSNIKSVQSSYKNLTFGIIIVHLYKAENKI